MENINDAHENVEFVGTTEISGFEQCEQFTNEQMADYISSVIPSGHLTDCNSIEYSPNNEWFVENHATGLYFPGSHEIDIASMERFIDSGEVLDTVTHEIGHNAHDWLKEYYPDHASKWEFAHMKSDVLYNQNGSGFVSEYARTSPREDFAETYSSYIRDPLLLKMRSPEKYSFMKDNVFSGMDYLPDNVNKNLNYVQPNIIAFKGSSMTS